MSADTVQYTMEHFVTVKGTVSQDFQCLQMIVLYTVGSISFSAASSPFMRCRFFLSLLHLFPHSFLYNCDMERYIFCCYILPTWHFLGFEMQQEVLLRIFPLNWDCAPKRGCPSNLSFPQNEMFSKLVVLQFSCPPK